MEIRIDHNVLIRKKEKLQVIAVALKSHFIGLEEVIDELMALMTPWYLFPEVQLRPTVINLWGMTGSGKTALVKEIVERLEYQDLYSHFDMGEFESDSSSWMKDIFIDDLEYFHEKPSIICMDEFQFAKTIDEKRELGRDKLRVVWEMMDSGRINYIPNSSTFHLFRADSCLSRLERVMTSGLVIKDGVIVGDDTSFLVAFSNFSFDEYNRKEELTRHYFLSDDFVNGLFNLYDQPPFTKDHLRHKIRSASLEDIAIMVREGMKTRKATRQLNLSQSLIFVLGNLDEAFYMSNSLNPDISADELHAATSKISIASIKKALRRRFRNEQIARLGNNHIIYKSFKNVHFEELIHRELKKVAAFVEKAFQWEIKFDQSVMKVVYAEGVFPSQGTRPVFTTVKNLIESKIGRIVTEVAGLGVIASSIVWVYREDTFGFLVEDCAGNVIHAFEDRVNLKTEKSRRSLSRQVKAHTAVHESGHAILACLTLRILPSVVVSETVSDDYEGFCIVNFPDGPMTRETIRKDIMITLGGYVAEKLIFGEERTSSGVSTDIRNATELANRAIRKYAMGTDPILISVASQENEDHFLAEEKYTQEAVRLIRSCMHQAEHLLTRNKLLLLKMSEYLTLNSRMEEPRIGDFVKLYSVEDWVLKEGFIKKDKYYRFYDEIKNQLDAVSAVERGDEKNRREPTLILR